MCNQARLPDGIKHIIDVLERRCAGQRALAERGHWSYDTQRHLGLLGAPAGEREALAVAIEEPQPGFMQAAE